MNAPVSLLADISPEVPGTYRELLAAAGLSSAEIRKFSELHDGRAIWDFIATVFLVLAIPLLYRWLAHPATVVACIFLTLYAFNRFSQLVHASDHGALLSSTRGNQFVGDRAANFLGYTRIGHRLTHQNHHLYLNTIRDPDKIWGEPGQHSRDIVIGWIHDLFLVSAIKRLAQYSQPDRKEFKVSPWRGFKFSFLMDASVANGSVIVTQLAVLAYYTLVIGPQYYFLFYVLPIFTIYPMLIRIRTAVEHSFAVGFAPKSDKEVWITRSIDSNIFERMLIATLNGGFHFEHHLLPGVPYYNLPLVRRRLQEQGFSVPIVRGYLAFLIRKWNAERKLASATSAA